MEAKPFSVKLKFPVAEFQLSTGIGFAPYSVRVNFPPAIVGKVKRLDAAPFSFVLKYPSANTGKTTTVSAVAPLKIKLNFPANNLEHLKSIPYPAIAPTAREITLRKLILRNQKTASGDTPRSPLASKPASSVLSLIYENIADSDANLFCECHRQSFGYFRDFVLSQQTWSGMGEKLAAYCKSGFSGGAIVSGTYLYMPNTGCSTAQPPSYRWLRNGSIISGATASFYVVTSPSDIGVTIQGQYRCGSGLWNTTAPVVTGVNNFDARWRFARQPVVESISSGRSSVRVELELSISASSAEPRLRIGFQWAPGQVSFPAIKPSTRIFTPPDNSTSKPKYLDAFQTPALLGSKGGSPLLSMSFVNIDDLLAASFCDAYFFSGHGLLPVSLPSETASGIQSADLASSILGNKHYDWYFSEALKITSVKKGVSTVGVELIGNFSIKEPPAPLLWVSRLTTATRSPQANGGAQGSIVAGLEGASFQAFWFEDPSTSGVRVAVVKRDARGFILWQVWTSAEFGTGATSRDAEPPQVVPLSDGGCVVLAGNTFNTSAPPADSTWMRAWRLSGDNSQTWAMQYAGQLRAPARAVINGSELIVLMSAQVTFNIKQPMLLRLNLSSGAVLGASAYQFDGTTSNYSPWDYDNLFSLASGSLSFTVDRQTFVEVSSNTSTVTRSVRFNSNSDARAIPGGGYLARNSDAQLMRLDSSFNITDRYKHSNAMQTNGDFWGLQTLALGVAADGSGYAISWNITSGNFLGRGLAIAKFSSFGGSITGYNEVAYGRSIGDPYPAMNHGIDIVAGRGFVHIVGNTGEASGCRVTAIGFALDQPTSTAANTTPTATLATGTCSNTMSVRGWDAVTYNTVTPDTINRTTVSTTVTAITITGATGSISMVDASSSLAWSRTSLAF